MANTKVPSANNFANDVKVFAALGDKTRLEIINRLCEAGPLSIARLADGTTISRQAITKHLYTLKAAEIVLNYRDGRESIWQIKTKRLREARQHLEQISKHWDAAIGRLKAYVESN